MPHFPPPPVIAFWRFLTSFYRIIFRPSCQVSVKSTNQDKYVSWLPLWGQPSKERTLVHSNRNFKNLFKKNSQVKKNCHLKQIQEEAISIDVNGKVCSENKFRRNFKIAWNSPKTVSNRSETCTIEITLGESLK